MSVDSTANRSLKPFAESVGTKPHKVHKIFNRYVIELGNELGILENTWYIQELQHNGDILLRKSTN